MNYRDIFKDKKMSDYQGEMIIEALEEWADENEELKVAMAIAANDDHLCEYSARHKIKKLKPLMYIDGDKKPIAAKDMCEYMAIRGVTPEIAHKHIQSSYNTAKIKAREMGMNLPELRANMWDAWYAMAKALCYHWCSACGDMEKASMLALEHIMKHYAKSEMK